MPDSNSTDSGTSADDQTEGSGASEPEYLPGLEPDEPQSVDPAPTEQPAPAPRNGSDTSATAREPERYGEGGWTNEELDRWYENEHGGDAGLTAIFANYRRSGSNRRNTPLGHVLFWMREEFEGLEETDLDWDLPEEETSQDALLSEAFLSGDGEFRNLSPDLKARYRDQVESLDAEAPAVDWANTSTSRVTVTLPDGSQLTEEIDQDGPSSSTHLLRDRAGDVTEEPGADYEPTDVGTPSTGGIGGFSPRLLIFGGGGILSLLALGFVLLVGGGSGSGGTYSVTDPRNDFVPTFSGTEAIENPSSAGDVTNMQVVVADGNTTVSVTFAGDAQALHAEGGEELAAALQFIPVGNERFIDMLFKEDGETKISDPPSGSRITSNWTAPNTLVFEITGVTPAKGATVRFATIQRLRSGHSTDEVLLSTGDEGSSLVTPEPVNAPSTRAPAPLVIQPCDVIDPTLAASIAGTTTEPTVSGTDRFQTCDYPGPPGASEGTGIRLIMAVTRNSAGGILDTYRSNNSGAVETRAVVWSDEGELWIHVEGTEFSKVELLAFVDIPGSRRIYVAVTMFGPAASAASMATAAETISALLNEAVLAAQP